MRHFLSFLLIFFTLTLQAQQQKKTTATSAQKAVPAKTATAKTATSTKTKEKQTQKGKQATSAKQTATSAKPAAPAQKTATPAKQAPAKQTPTKQTPAKSATTGNKSIKQLKSEQATLQRQIKESETAIRDTKNNVSAQLANLAVLSGHISSQKEYVQGIQAEVDTLSRNITALGRDIMFLEEDLVECKKKYAHGMMYMYRTRLSQNKLMFIFSAKDFSQMYRRIRYAQEYTKYQRAQAIVLQKKEEAVRKKRDELTTTNKKKAALLKEGKQRQKELEQQQRERQTVVDDLNRKQQQLQATLEDQKRKSQQLNSRIDQLVQEEIRKAEEKRKAEEARRKAEMERQRRAEAERQRLAEAERQRKEQAEKVTASKTKTKDNQKSDKKASKATGRNGNKSNTPAQNSTTSTPKFKAPDNTDRQLSSNFAANQGHLPVPITGSYVISAHFGPYTPEGLNGVTLDNKGTNYSGSAGAQARSIFDGEVTSVFSLGGMTNVIVRHGSYISVYCNLASASVRVGQRVTTRQILGPIANDASGNCTLHFQLRKETAKLNPENWIGR